MSKLVDFNQLLTKEVDRRQFIGFIGAALLVITGVGGLLEGLGSLGQPKASSGYGSSSYGDGGEGARRRIG